MLNREEYNATFGLNVSKELYDEIMKKVVSPFDPNIESFTLTNGKEKIELRPVKKGHWYMLSYDEAVCSCCGYNRNTPFDSTKEAKEKWNELPPYCEMCGADMREVK